jgi:hypothetical protein
LDLVDLRDASDFGFVEGICFQDMLGLIYLVG